MIMKTFKYFFLLSGFIAFLLASCEKLDVKNENDPDFKTAFSNPSDVKGVAGSLINSWFNSTQKYDGPGLALWVAADAGTCSWGNRGMRDFGTEPRKVFDNTPAYGDAVLSEGYYKTMYSILSSSNEVLGKLEHEGMVISADNGTDETPMVRAMAYLSQGLSLGYIGLVYDKAFIVTHHTDLATKIPTSSYMVLIDSALISLDKCIEICANNTFTFPTSWVPGIEMTQQRVSEFANSMAARFLSYSPRNKTEDNAVDWTKVLDYANKGLTYDFSPQMDAAGIWYDELKDYANASTWGQTDMRVVHMMHPAMPARWTGDALGFSLLPAHITSHTAGVDDRIFTDFEYLSSCPFNPERGYYFFSCYRHKRFDDYLATYTTTVTVFRKSENDLLKAEALFHQPSLSAAAAIINAGTRVTRGALDPIGSTADEVEKAIFYERNVELYGSAMGLEFFIMRKADKLQSGTPLHLPIPGQQLAVNLMDYYTFGATEGVAGQDVSSGGWSK
jgi:starch-binding outer membrane protein, SusD/RagB family